MSQLGQVKVKQVSASGAAYKTRDITAGDMGLQRASDVSITGGTVAGVSVSDAAINDSVIGGTTPAAATFTTVDTTLLEAVNISSSDSVAAAQLRVASTGDLNRYAETQTIVLPDAAATLDTQAMGFVIPADSRVIGVLFRVDAALAAGTEWNATWDANHGALAMISAGGGAVTLNSKYAWWQPHNQLDVTSADADITLTTNAAVNFDGGTITATVFYEYFTPMPDV